MNNWCKSYYFSFCMYAAGRALFVQAVAPARTSRALCCWRDAHRRHPHRGKGRRLEGRVGFDSGAALKVIRMLSGASNVVDTTTVATAVRYPTQTTRRALEDLTAHGVVKRSSGDPARTSGGYPIGHRRDAHRKRLAATACLLEGAGGFNPEAPVIILAADPAKYPGVMQRWAKLVFSSGRKLGHTSRCRSGRTRRTPRQSRPAAATSAVAACEWSEV
jgi:hypothetical protein